ncbi:MAG TPA: hypothetical protein VNJ01_12855 [Bacteriovoracaceae bacterium]|nr:hypothetical protein [Bacteriovoracaceae bacterium]
MRTIVIFILFFSSLVQGQIEFSFSKAKIKQGSIEKASIRIGPETMQRLSLQKLKGATLGDSIYLYDVAVLNKKTGQDIFEADAKVIFVKVPPSSEIIDKSFGSEVLVRWNAVEIIPTQASEGLIFGSFKVPDRPKIILWSAILAGVLAALMLGFRIWKRLKQKREVRSHRLRLKNDLLGARTFEDLVVLWKKKSHYLTEFPQVTEAFGQFETVLFKYQFKPSPSEQEMSMALDAYGTFVRNVEGGLRGV